MPLDPQRVRFSAKAIVAAHQAGGTLDSAEARQLLDELFIEWTASGLRFDELPEWLSARLRSEFQSIGAAPVWVEEEPGWPFFDGEPMVFISQSSVEGLSPGETVYVFAAKRERGKGFEMHYRVVSQFGSTSR